MIPQSVAFHTIQVDEASSIYEAIKGGVSQLQLNYFSILGLTTLAVVFGFVWLGTLYRQKDYRSFGGFGGKVLVSWQKAILITVWMLLRWMS